MRAGPLVREEFARLEGLDQTDVLVQDARIVQVGRGLGVPAAATVIDADGRVLMPAFVDCHTHACWAGDRLDEWEQKLGGATYLELLHAGGGIMSTVRAVRDASRQQLVVGLSHRLGRVLREGTTAIEIKSGYGLTTRDELKMLEAIAEAADAWDGTVVPTACIGHAIDPETAEGFVDRTIQETLSAVHESFPGITIDAYCETGAWSREDCVRLFERALELGHPVRVHADQFTSLGLISDAIRLGFQSVDHLEATSEEDLAALASSEVFGVALPCSGFHVDGRYANARRFVDAGGRLAIATNYNPGSAPSPSVPMAIALATRCLGLTPAEAIHAATVNGAALLGIEVRTIAAGAPADLILLTHHDERQLAYEYGGTHVDAVFCAGRIHRFDG